ncbi:MAG: AraC family transcriptional activator of pobA [Salibacteraceae bacterium]|jgi:AraC-like DNA-binding protein
MKSSNLSADFTKLGFPKPVFYIPTPTSNYLYPIKNKIPIYKIGEEDHSNYIEVVELMERNSYDTSQPHKHEYIEVFLFSKGGGVHDIDFTDHVIHDYSVHFVFPNQIHKVKRAFNTNGHVVLVSKAYFYGLDYDLYVRFFHAFFLQPSLNVGAKVFQELGSLLDTMKTELKVQNPFYQEIVKDYVHVLVKRFLREQAIAPNAIQETHVHFKLYMDLVILVENNFLEHPPVSFYSEALHVSVRKLNEVCKEFHSGTCSAVIHDRIVLEAKKLLSYSDRSVKDVMFALNFKDAAYFNRFFKSKTGITPTAFRQQSSK